MPLSKPKKVSLSVRLSKAELTIIEQVLETMGEGASKSEVIEEALRRYLPMVDSSGRFVQHSRTAHGEQRRVSQFAARRYKVDPRIVRDLDRVSSAHHWPKTELIRQAILMLGEQG